MTPVLFIPIRLSFSMDEKEAEARPVMGTIFLVTYNWASEVNPTLGCSIEISYICRYVVCSMSYVVCSMSYVCRMSN